MAIAHSAVPVCGTLNTVGSDQLLSVEPDPLHPTGAESEGLSLPSGCRVGECESCTVHIVSGCVRYLNGVESDDPSVCLTCSAVPASNLVLDA